MVVTHKQMLAARRKVRDSRRKQRGLSRFMLSPGEKKFLDYTVTHTVLNTAAGVEINTDNMMAPGQGSGASQRIGRKIYVHGLQLQGRLHYTALQHANANDNFTYDHDYVKLVVVLDTQANNTGSAGTVTGWSGIFNDVSGADNMSEFRNLEKIGRYRVLEQKLIKPPPAVITYSDDVTAGKDKMHTAGADKYFDYYWKPRQPLVVHFNGSTPGSADIADNLIRLLIIRQHASGSGRPTIDCHLNTRIRYTD